jgi:excisionase family DNA binding protein
VARREKGLGRPFIGKEVKRTVMNTTRLLRLDEALPLTGYRSQATLRRLIASGELPAVRLSKRALRIREDDLRAFIDARSRDNGACQSREKEPAHE